MKIKLRKDYSRITQHKHRLSPDKIYTVIGIEADNYRVIDDAEEPVLFSPKLFEVVDAQEPDDWVTEYGTEGERYSYPPQLASAGFFEDFFDGDQEVKQVFWNYVKKANILD